MAKEHAQAVRKSDLYEYKGISKSLLERIAYLIVGARKEDERGHPIGEPKPNEGYCTASQEVLAAMHGCSEREVGRQVDKFVKDGWLTRYEYRNEAGHRHYKYSMTPKQLKAIRAREMKKYPDDHEKAGYYIRAKNMKMKRDFHPGKKLSGSRSSTHVEPTLNTVQTHDPHDSLSGSQTTTSRGGLTTACTKPHDKESVNGLSTGVVLPSLVEKMGCSSEPTPRKTRRDASTSTKEGKKTQEAHDTSVRSEKNQRKGSARPPRMAAFKPEVESQFRAMGAPDLWFEAMAPLTGTIDMLNGENLCGCPFPVKSWATTAANHPEWKASQLWVPKVTESGDLEYSEANSLADQIILKRMNASLTEEERETNRAQWWWGNLEIPERETYNVPYIEKGDFSYYDTKGIVKAYRGVQAAKGVVKRNESDGARATVTPEAGTHAHDYDLSAIDDI